jgi:hypothetical protein
MKFIAIVETHYFGGPRELALRIEKDDGNVFDLPVSMEQASLLMAEMGLLQEPTRAKPKPPPSTPARSFLDEEEDEEVDTIRLAHIDGVQDGEKEEGL